jgi:hypothetical protein
MQELSNLSGRRYLIRSLATKEKLAIIEAVSTAHALDRAAQLVGVTTVIPRGIELEATQVDMPMALPTFLEGYFNFFKQIEKVR